MNPEGFCTFTKINYLDHTYWSREQNVDSQPRYLAGLSILQSNLSRIIVFRTSAHEEPGESESVSTVRCSSHELVEERAILFTFPSPLCVHANNVVSLPAAAGH